MKHKYEIVVQQYQIFEFETDGPITEDDFWNDLYGLEDCDLDSHIVEMKETVGAIETITESTHPADKWDREKFYHAEKDKESLQSLIDILWDYVSESDIPEINRRMEEEE